MVLRGIVNAANGLSSASTAKQVIRRSARGARFARSESKEEFRPFTRHKTRKRGKVVR